MKWDDFQEGMFVQDVGESWTVMRIIKKLKTRLYIRSNGKIQVWDKQHAVALLVLAGEVKTPKRPIRSTRSSSYPEGYA